MSADPRVVDNESQGILVLPFNIEVADTAPSLTTEDIGKPVALTANNEISEGDDGEAFLGKLIGITDDRQVGLVQVGGVCTGLPYSGTAPVIGWPVQMSGEGTVDKGVTDGICRGFTVNVDSGAVTCDVLL